MPPFWTDLFASLSKTMVTLPASEVVILLGLITFCLLFRWNRAGLIIAYLDAYRWGWIFFNEFFGKEYQSYIMGYYLFGGIVFILFIVGFLMDSR